MSASRFQFVTIEPAHFFKIGQEIMSLWQKIILNRGFAVTRGIIYEHKFSFNTIFLTRPEHSNFNACKIFVKIMMILVIMKENPHLSHYFFIIFGTRAKWNKLGNML